MSDVRNTLAEQVYTVLKQQIQNFTLVAGDRLSESGVGRQLGVSRTPVREALFRLRDEEFLEVAPQLGWFVKPIDFIKIGQLYDLRILIELACVKRICKNETRSAAFDALQAVWMRPNDARLYDPVQLGALDEVFHATLVKEAGNEEFSRVHADLTEKIRIVRRLDFTRVDRIDATYEEHAQILRALILRRAEHAQLLMRGHIERSKQEVTKITLQAVHDARTHYAAALGQS